MLDRACATDVVPDERPSILMISALPRDQIHGKAAFKDHETGFLIEQGLWKYKGEKTVPICVAYLQATHRARYISRLEYNVGHSDLVVFVGLAPEASQVSVDILAPKRIIDAAIHAFELSLQPISIVEQIIKEYV